MFAGQRSPSVASGAGGDVKLTELLATLADCPKARAAGIYDRCKAVYEGLRAR
jgi:hypothetical protein